MTIKASNYAFRYVNEPYGINVDKIVQSLRPCTAYNIKTIFFQTNIHLEINIVGQFHVCFVTQCRHLINIYFCFLSSDNHKFHKSQIKKLDIAF